jgi:hypothetical protein
MRLAARFWLAEHGAADYRLSAIELTGNPPRVVGAINAIEL